MTDKAAPSKGLDRMASDLAAPVPPTPRQPIDCGHFDIRIDRAGGWSYRGSPITRLALVRLFSSVLQRDEGGAYWLVTPVERGRITVDDAPFVAVELVVRGTGRQQELIFRTNLDETVAAGADHPLRVVNDSATGAPNPYILIRAGLEARLNRPVFYDLVELGREERVGDATLYGVWSTGMFFPLGRLDGTH
jgi:hypothetical protein